jgi:bifunctional non-homologous end joining protein LigD
MFEKTLYYQNDETNSDKVYKAWLEKEGDLYNVFFAYGRYGTELKEGCKTPTPVEYETARSIINRLIDSKIKKGYIFNQS